MFRIQSEELDCLCCTAVLGLWVVTAVLAMKLFQPHLPAALLLLWSTWSGTFWGGSLGVAVWVGHLSLVAFAALAGTRWKDPLALGAVGRWVLLALVLVVGVSGLASPVPRAGRLVLTLLPAFLLIPGAVANCWGSAVARRLGLRSVAMVVALVAGWSLVELALGTSQRAALPLGHHNQLALWLLGLLPLTVLPWREGGSGRWLAGSALLLGGGALLATQSLGAALAALMVVAVLVLARLPLRWRVASLATAAAVLLLQMERLLTILRGGDSSSWARWVYWQAGFRGIEERPFLGWGPGSTAWTLGLHLRPEPGVNPAGEVVPDLHSLPLGLLYELGICGVVLGVVVTAMFVSSRWREESKDRPLLWAALLGLFAWGVGATLSGLPAVGALPLVAALTLGAVLAAGGERSDKGSWWPAVGGAFLIFLTLLPVHLGALAYDRAREAETEAGAMEALRDAVAYDAAFPLYRGRLAWLTSNSKAVSREAAEDALRAAESAPGISLLWTMAGVLGQEIGAPWSRRALVSACWTSPLEAPAPFFLATGEPRQELSVSWAVRALLAEPRLLAAAGWRRRPGLLGEAVERLLETEGVDAGWRLAVAETFAELGEPEGAVRGLAVALDRDPAASLSLHSFRRRPWPSHLARIDLVTDALARIDLVPAPEIPSTEGWLFAAEECALGK